jgi:hypothetical protein
VEFSLIDFFIGFFLMNAMPHLLFGLLKVRFFSAFGFSASGNLAYAFVNVVTALILFHAHYGVQALATHGIVIGAMAMLFIYLVSGRFFYDLFQKNGSH